MIRGMPHRPNPAAQPSRYLHPIPTWHPIWEPSPSPAYSCVCPSPKCIHSRNVAIPSTPLLKRRALARVGDVVGNPANPGPAPRAYKSGGKDSHSTKRVLGSHIPLRQRADTLKKCHQQTVRENHFQREQTRAKAQWHEALEEAKGLRRAGGREQTGPDGASGQGRT